MRGVAAGVGFFLAALGAPAAAQERSSDNAVTQAEDAFGFSVGRESVGIYSAGSTRGFSPTAAGNVRIDGLYFDAAFNLTSLLSDSSSIKVGLSAQGYPFAAPSGVVDLRLRRPEFRSGGSLVMNADSYGTIGAELSGSLPLSETLALGYGASAGSTAYPDGTDNTYHDEALLLRWRPLPGLELLPFWSVHRDFQNESGPFYIPAGAFIPPLPPPHKFAGPHWASFNFAGIDEGLLASAAASPTWLVRLGAFRSIWDQRTSFGNLLVNIQSDGSADRLIIADPPTRAVSNSGELRVTHSIAEGPRLHVFHLSLRERDAHREYGGAETFDLGPTRLGAPVTAPEPTFAFGPLSRDRVRQETLGLAYIGRWKGRGEIGFGLSRAAYRKTTTLPGIGPIVARATPWLYNATAAITLTHALSVYAGYARGLEESGLAPQNASNRNAPLPATLTSQRDAGLRLALTPKLKLVTGAFDLRKPYFGFDGSQAFRQVGTTRNRGAEVSLAGALTNHLDIVAGGVFLDARVERDAFATGSIGRRPVGLPSHSLNLNLNWRTPVNGLSLDAAAYLRGSVAATSDNAVILGERKVVNFGARFRTSLSGRAMTFRLQASNVLNDRTWGTAGPGIYAANPGRSVNGYLALDL
ncbi:MAG: TonB-dependent receptor [Novosphingobium sp.]|nr:TonB-dependent receptor [Novosphingobium sp.]